MTLTAIGAIAVVAAWGPVHLSERPLSLPIVVLGLGAVVFFIVPAMPDVDPTEHVVLTERVTELGVLISLLGAGLAIDRRPSWRAWRTTWRLLSFTMLGTIGVIAVFAWAVIGLDPATALVIGAALAPTDPVLAADVQVGEPTVDAEVHTPSGEVPVREDEARFALTSEAGLNDGLAFPFVYAAIAMASQGAHPREWMVSWFFQDVLLRLVVALIVGWLAGRLLARLVFNPPGRLVALAETTEGFVAVGAILFTYGLTEIAFGYGFLAVFVAAVTLRAGQRHHPYHRTLYEFCGQIEHLFVVGLLFLLGGSVATGVLSGLTWKSALIAPLLIFAVRPAIARASLIGTATSTTERRIIGFFGIKGIGSIYYLAYATGHGEFSNVPEMWATVVLVVVVSIVVHGVTATPVMRRVDERRMRRAAR